MAVPVDAVPKVVATHIAALGPKAATAAPAPSPTAPPTPDFTVSLCAFSAYSSVSRKFLRSVWICSSVTSKSFGLFAMLLTSVSMLRISTSDSLRSSYSA